MGKWELDFVNDPNYYCQRLIAMISGYEINEVLESSNDVNCWRTKDFIETFNKLGYQCDSRFKKFYPEIESPVLLRCKILNDPSHWFACVYCEGKAYIPGHGIFTIEQLEKTYTDLKISSMLKVWLSTKC